MNILRFVLSAALVLCIAAPVAAEGHAWGRQCDKTATPVLHQQFSGIDEEGFRIIDNETEWCEFWDQVHSIMFPAPPCDTTSIDFATEVALVATLGGRPNSCHGVEIECVQALGASGNIRVHVAQWEPGENCACLQVVVHPVDVVKVDRPVEKAQMRWKTSALDCP